MDEKKAFDFWYAVNNTNIVLTPSRHLETFCSTVLHYHMLSELMDSVGQVRVREGRLQASRPQIITPEAYSQTLLEGFGEEAGKYVDWLKEHDKEIRILQYGYKLKQKSFSEHVVSDSIEAVTGRVKAEVESGSDPMSAVLVGVDTPWDVCLVKLFWEVIQQSAQMNVQELTKHHMFEREGGVPRGVRHEIDAAFLAASKDAALIKPLGSKLQSYGLFEDYQDRFFSLVRASEQ